MGRRVLLVIDVQGAFVNPKTQPVVDNIEKHIASSKYDLILQSRWMNCLHSKFITELGCETGLSNEDTELALAIPGSYVVTRRGYSCICPAMQRFLRRGDTIYVCGLETDSSVLATCFSLWDLEYKFHVLKDCVGTDSGIDISLILELIKRQFGKGSLI